MSCACIRNPYLQSQIYIDEWTDERMNGLVLYCMLCMDEVCSHYVVSQQASSLETETSIDIVG